MDKEIFNKITSKKEFSKLPKKDIERVFNKFEKREVSEEEKIRLSRELLHKVYGSFTSQKLLSIKDKDSEWIMRKHLSTRERLPYFKELYRKLKINGSVIDLAAGINGFSYSFFPQGTEYIGIEGVGQLVDLMNYYFKKEKLKAKAYHMSLFDMPKLKEVIAEVKKPKIVFLFKALDSLEMLEKDYSKKLLEEITPLVDRVVVSFATRSMISRKKFRVDRRWFIDFIGERFKILSDFELGGERYIVFKNKK